ncbi:MAG: tetratricopeptide repeat protein, partial [Hormoscilla sp. GM102CHS1]|nr:tetratricopeptide repeat protein [Hormoscilla sp. GM102CHS1]MBC6473395.1 tetratricopeptide repeat protein [Hormoscilla sp. GM102CHS1]
RYDEVIASYDKAIEIEPDDHPAWYNRGYALLQLSRYDEAIASYDKAIEIKPDDYEAWNNLGNALYQLSRYDEAIASYDKAIEIKASSLLFRLESYKTNCEKMEEVIEAMRARDRAKQRDARIL